MKNLSRLFVVLAIVVAASFALSSSAFGASRLVYSDEFNGPLTTATWTNDTPWNTHYTTGELEYYDPADCTFSGGTMNLKSEKRASNGYTYTSGIVTSLPHTKFSYGYFEIRAKLPKGPGIWPAFWLTNDSTLEIDGLEMLGDQPSRIYQTLHENDSQIYQGIKDGPDYSAGFHTYAIDWQPTYVKWYIDGVVTAQYNHAMPSDPMWICLNTAVGGAWPGSPTSATTFPVNYAIDYVHVYDTKPAAYSPPVANADSYAIAVGTTLTVAAPGLLANDSGMAGLTVSALTQPTHGALTLAPNGSFTYTPDPGFTGVDSFMYATSDGTSTSSAASVALNVQVPAPPSPTIVTKPVVKRRGHTRPTYRVTGWMRRGHIGQIAQSVAAPTLPFTVRIQIQRLINGQWRGYSSAGASKTSSRYTSTFRLRKGTFRVRTVVGGGVVPSAASAWTAGFTVK